MKILYSFVLIVILSVNVCHSESTEWGDHWNTLSRNEKVLHISGLFNMIKVMYTISENSCEQCINEIKSKHKHIKLVTLLKK